MRLAIAGISQESLARSPRLTSGAEIQIYRGQELLDANLWLIRGMMARLRETKGVEAIPLLWATALPGGPLSRDAYYAVKEETLELLEAQGPFDGVLLANHGALEVENLPRSADSDFIESVRSTIGPETPLGVAFDLHGNLTETIAQAGTVFSALRTAPHRDDLETGYRVADQIISVISRGLNPQTALVKIPILAVGEATMTHYEPMNRLYALLLEVVGQPGVMDALLMVGFAFNDKPWTGMSVLVTTEDDIRQAQEVAATIANKVWAARNEIGIKVPTASISEGLSFAADSDRYPVFLSDSGDNTTAGAPGDLTIVLQAALEMHAQDVVIPGIFAPQAVKQCHDAGIGAQLRLALGSEHISLPRDGLAAEAVVEDIGSKLIPSGFQPYRTCEGAWARVRIGGVIATFHEFPIGITTAGHFTAMGIDPTCHRTYVVKVGYLHPQLEELARRHIMLLSPGLTPVDVKDMPWQTVPRPVFPLDPDMTWQA